MLSNDQPLGRAGFEAVGSLGLIDHSNDPLALDDSLSAARSTYLSDLIDTSTSRPSVDDILGWADQLLDAIHQLHTQPRPVVHGGIAPSSVLLEGKTIKLLPASDTSETDANVSFKPLEQMWESLDDVTQRVILNPMDEKAQNSLLKDPSPASDIYSVGATMYAVATGALPADALDRTIADMEGKPDPLLHPSELSPAIPAEIGDAIVKAMSLRREDRPFSAIILRQVFRTATVKVQERLASEPAIELAPVMVTVPEPANIVREEADADHARQLALKILAEKNVVQMDEEILDLGVPAADAPAVEQAPAPASVELSLADVIEAEPVQTAVHEPRVISPVVDSYEDVTPSFLDGSVAEDQPRSSSKGMAIGIAAASVVIAAIAGFFVFSSRSPAPAAPSPVVASEAPATASQPIVEPAAQTQAEPEQNVPVAVPDTADPNARERNTRAAITPADKTKKNAQPAPAKPAPTKKQVTVDDLINDN